MQSLTNPPDVTVRGRWYAGGAKVLMRSLVVFLFALSVSIGVGGCGDRDDLAQARALQSQGRMKASLPILEKLVEERPDDPEVNFRFGLAVGRLHDPGRAVWALRKAAEDEDWTVLAGLELAAGAIQLMNWSTAIEIADRVIEIAPDDVRGRVLRAEAHIGRKTDVELALEDLDHALELAPRNERARTLRTMALIMAGRIDEAAESLDPSELDDSELSLDEDAKARRCITHSVFLDEQGREDEARMRIGRCLEEYASNAQVVSKGIAFFDRRGEFVHATQILERAVEESSAPLNFRVALASRYRVLGEPKQAESLLRQVLDSDSPIIVSGAWTALTEHFMELGDLGSAADCYAEAMALASDPPARSLLEFADLLARAGRLEDARSVARRLDNEVYRDLVEAHILLIEHEPAQALARFDEALPYWPNNAAARYYAARAAEQTGDFKRAIEEYRQSLRSNAKMTDAGLRLAKLYAGMGDLEAAWIALSHHRSAQPDDPEGIETTMRLLLHLGAEERFRTQLEKLGSTPLRAQALAMRAEEIAASRGWKASVVWIQNFTQLDLNLPDNLPLVQVLVDQLLRGKKNEEARQVAEAATQAHPEIAEFHVLLAGVLAHDERDLVGAIQAYDRALSRSSSLASAIQGVARIAEIEGRFDDALAGYDRASELAPEDASAARSAADLAARVGSSEDAEARWKSLLREHPWDADARMAIVELRLARGLNDEETRRQAMFSVQFRGGARARELLAQVQKGHGEGEAQSMNASAPVPNAASVF